MSPSAIPPSPHFEDDEAYEASLRDADFWAPYAKAALRAVGLSSAGRVRTHFPTTHVAALVGERYLVKLHYEEWFGEDSFQTEREAYRMLTARRLPVPALLAEGALYPDGPGWRWPFLVMSAMPGRSMRELGPRVGAADRRKASTWLGRTLRALHAVAVVDGEFVSHEEYCDLIQTRMRRASRDHELWGSLPEHLRPHVRDYLWEARELLDPDRAKTVFLHGDLHDGNVFLEPSGDGFRPVGIVDFNDVYEGDPHYDLVAVHLKALGADKDLLARLLKSYGWDDLGRKWARRMMAFTLAHDYDMIQPFADRFGARLGEVRELDELASLLWDLEAPGLA